MSTNPPQIAYTCAADLYRAILACAAVSPMDDAAHSLPDYRPADEGEPAELCLIEKAIGPHQPKIAERTPVMHMHGPVRPWQSLRQTFAYCPEPGTRSSFTIIGTRPRLLAMAEHVRKHWALYGGGPKPAELKSAPVKRAAWPTPIVRVWRQQLEDRDYVGAMLTGEQIGAQYFPGNKDSTIVLAAPLQVEGLPEGLCSARRGDGRWVVSDMQSGRCIGSRGFGSRKSAEESAVDEWARLPDDKRETVLQRARADAGSIDHDAARAAWCKAYGIADPRIEDPAQAIGAQTEPDEAPAEVAEVADDAGFPPSEPGFPPTPAAENRDSPTPGPADSQTQVPQIPAPEPICNLILHNVLVPLRNAAPDGIPNPAAMLREAARIEAAGTDTLAECAGKHGERWARQVAVNYSEVARMLREMVPAPEPERAPIPADSEPVPPLPQIPAHPLAESAAKIAELQTRKAGANPDKSGFYEHLIEAHQSAHNKLAAAFAVFDAIGDGAELASPDGRQFCVLLPDASSPGKYRWQGFDARGFFTHSTHDTAALAVADAARYGFTVAAPGALDRLASTPEWARGMAINAVMQSHNSGQITWADACDQMAKIHAEHEALQAEPAAQSEPEPVPMAPDAPMRARPTRVRARWAPMRPSATQAMHAAPMRRPGQAPMAGGLESTRMPTDFRATGPPPAADSRTRFPQIP